MQYILWDWKKYSMVSETKEEKKINIFFFFKIEGEKILYVVWDWRKKNTISSLIVKKKKKN